MPVHGRDPSRAQVVAQGGSHWSPVLIAARRGWIWFGPRQRITRSRQPATRRRRAGSGVWQSAMPPIETRRGGTTARRGRAGRGGVANRGAMGGATQIGAPLSSRGVVERRAASRRRKAPCHLYLRGGGSPPSSTAAFSRHSGGRCRVGWPAGRPSIAHTQAGTAEPWGSTSCPPPPLAILPHAVAALATLCAVVASRSLGQSACGVNRAGPRHWAPASAGMGCDCTGRLPVAHTLAVSAHADQARGVSWPQEWEDIRIT